MVVTHASVTGTGMCHRAFCTDPRGCQRLPWRSTARPEHVSDRRWHRSVDPAHTWVKDFAKKCTHSTLRNIKLSVPSAKSFPHMWTTAVHAQRQRNCEVARCQFRSLEHKTLHLISAQWSEPPNFPFCMFGSLICPRAVDTPTELLSIYVRCSITVR